MQHDDRQLNQQIASGTDGKVDPAGDLLASGRMDDLAQIIEAYNNVTDKLQHSHEKLQSEVLRLREELASTNAQLQRSKRLSALGEMAAGIAHEIRNPLAAIQLYAQMVQEDLGLSVKGEMVDNNLMIDNTGKIVSAVRGLNGIVNDVLSFAREIQIERGDVCVGALLGGAIEAHFPAIDAAGVTVMRDDLEHADLMLQVDEQLMGQVLVNLVRNAVDAMADWEGDRVLRLGVRFDESESVVVLSVSDSGPGIDGDAVDRIFNPFFTTRNTGTGLGLAIVHRIVEAHGGAIVVGNTADSGGKTVFAANGGGGAVFELHFPVKTVMASEHDAVVMAGT
ncbi:sensor histidine kinase [Poriferisphaera sp. WC338]|uniref:sensor histidine kinase n=1 Tax=Poriferisphaera sp. WC338 TaxID=3425129 RepID=UPI003D81AB2D